ncbi:MAG: hypothetical protein Q9199_002300 [Rusavskia elegans]
MPSNKNRLYVVLYARGGAANRDPSNVEETGTLFHAKDTAGPWEFEERDINVVKSGMMLARIVVAKVTDDERLKAALRGVDVLQGDTTWNCVTWVEHALRAVADDGKAGDVQFRLGARETDCEGLCQEKEGGESVQ